MKEEATAAKKARNFVEMWSEKPHIVMGTAPNRLESARSFLFGVKWAAAFREPDMEAFRHFLESFDCTLSRHLTGSDDGVSWFDALLERHDGDQNRAFEEFVQRFQDIAEQEGCMAPDDGENHSTEGTPGTGW